MESPERAPSRGPAALLALIVALLGGAWLLFSGDRNASAADLALESGDTDQGSAALSQGVPLEPPADSPSRVDSVGAEPVGKEGIASDSAKRLDLEGKPILALAGQFVEYVNGAPRALTFDGLVRATVSDDGHGRSRDVRVEGGGFEVYLEDGDPRPGDSGDAARLTIQIEAPTSSSGAAYAFVDPAGELLSRGERMPFGTHDATFAIRRVGVIELTVLGRDSGAHLDHIDVYAASGMLMNPGDPRGQTGARLLEHGASSPVLVQPTGGLAASTKVDLAVGAEGYAWSMLTVDFTKPKERVVKLDRAGQLMVHLVGELPAAARIRLRRDGQMESERRVVGSEVLYKHLAPGDYLVRVEVGEWYPSPVVLATAQASVYAGAENEIFLEVKRLGPVTEAAVRGRIFLPESWGVHSPQWSLQRISKSMSGAELRRSLGSREVAAINDEPGWFSLQLDSLETGRFALVLSDVSFAAAFDLPPEGLTDLLIEVPPPVQIRVLIQDASSGMDVPEIRSISWTPERPKGMTSWSSQTAKRDTEDDGFSIRVPACTITVHAQSQAHTHDLLSFLPTDGQELVLEVRPRTSRWIELRSGEDRIPWPSDGYPEVTSEQGEPVHFSLGFGSDGFWVGVNEPGIYRIQLPEISGYLPLDPVEVDMQPGPRQSLVIHLVPE